MGTVLYILAVHWIADFVFQTEQMATLKSTSWKWLSHHIIVYTAVLFTLSFPILREQALLFAALNGGSHFVIDAVTSRFTAYFRSKADFHNFFVVIGLDQLLHTSLLILSLHYLTNESLFR